jgi:hypothetical protein
MSKGQVGGTHLIQRWRPARTSVATLVQDGVIKVMGKIRALLI